MSESVITSCYFGPHFGNHPLPWLSQSPQMFIVSCCKRSRVVYDLHLECSLSVHQNFIQSILSYSLSDKQPFEVKSIEVPYFINKMRGLWFVLQDGLLGRLLWKKRSAVGKYVSDSSEVDGLRINERRPRCRKYRVGEGSRRRKSWLVFNADKGVPIEWKGKDVMLYCRVALLVKGQVTVFPKLAYSLVHTIITLSPFHPFTLFNQLPLLLAHFLFRSFNESLLVVPLSEDGGADSDNGSPLLDLPIAKTTACSKSEDIPMLS